MYFMYDIYLGLQLELLRTSDFEYSQYLAKICKIGLYIGHMAWRHFISNL